MQVRGRLFPYPVLNHNKVLSRFGEKEFIISFEKEENEKEYILKNVKFETDSNLINKLFDEGIIKINFIVECSSTVYRKTFELNREGKTIVLSKVDFSEKVDVSMFATATQNFTLVTDEIDEDYAGVDFEIEKYDIIAANDGFNITFKHEETEENLAKSIFYIDVNHDVVDGPYTVECNTGKKIIVLLSENDFKNYKIIHSVPMYKELFFNMFLIPALIEGLTLCRIYLNEDLSRDLEDVGNQYFWFRSVMNSYKRMKGEDLSVDDFKKCSLSYLAQYLFANPMCQSLIKLVNATKNEDGGDD